MRGGGSNIRRRGLQELKPGETQVIMLCARATIGLFLDITWSHATSNGAVNREKHEKWNGR